MTSDRLHALQRPDGSFESIVMSRDGHVADSNGFTAAMVLRLTRHVPDDPVMAAVRQRALHFLTTCASSRVPGAFAFWPDTARPPWASSVPADVDDSAVMLTELLRAGWLDRTDGLRRFCRAVLPQRVSAADAAMLPPWIAAGCFHTWIVPADVEWPRGKPSVNVVDCCVNANVVALMAQMRAQHLPGYDAAIRSVADGIRWAGDSRQRLSAVTPFYPSARSLFDAVEHAVECGAEPLRESLQRLGAVQLDTRDRDAGCCRSAYGSTVWHCRAIDTARALAGSMVRPTPPRISRDIGIAPPG